MASGTRLRTLPTLEVKGLYLSNLVQVPAEPGGGQFVEVATIGCLLLGKHASLARANACAGHLRASRKSRLRLFTQGTEAHVADEQRNLKSGFFALGP